MITSALLYIVYGFVFIVTSPLRLLPNATLPAGLASAIATANGYITSISPIFPVSTLLTILAAVLGIETFIFTWKLINWVLRRFPTQS